MLKLNIRGEIIAFSFRKSKDRHKIESNLEKQIGKFNSKLNFYKLIPYLVDRCICPALCRSRQTLEKKRPELGSGRDQ